MGCLLSSTYVTVNKAWQNTDAIRMRQQAVALISPLPTVASTRMRPHLSFAQNGLGTMIPILSLADTLDHTLYLPWVDHTNGSGAFSADDVMARVTRGFSGKQLGATTKVSEDEMGRLCTQNPSGKSRCFAGVIFDSIGATDNVYAVNYTLRTDSSLGYVDVRAHKSDYELRMLPLQWAIESVSMQDALCGPLADASSRR